jgi:hypothetical protein
MMEKSSVHRFKISRILYQDQILLRPSQSKSVWGKSVEIKVRLSEFNSYSLHDRQIAGCNTEDSNLKGHQFALFLRCTGDI